MKRGVLLGVVVALGAVVPAQGHELDRQRARHAASGASLDIAFSPELVKWTVHITQGTGRRRTRHRYGYRVRVKAGRHTYRAYISVRLRGGQVETNWRWTRGPGYY